jgi:hypothetical protein
MSSTTEYIPFKTVFDKELTDIESAVLSGPQEYENFFEAKKSVLYDFMKEDMDVDSREYVLNVMPITIRISVFKDHPEWAAEYLDSLEPLDQGLLLLRFDEGSRENIFKASEHDQEIQLRWIVEGMMLIRDRVLSGDVTVDWTSLSGMEKEVNGDEGEEGDDNIYDGSTVYGSSDDEDGKGIKDVNEGGSSTVYGSGEEEEEDNSSREEEDISSEEEDISSEEEDSSSTEDD